MRKRTSSLIVLIIIAVLCLFMCCFSMVCALSAGFANQVFKYFELDAPFPTQEVFIEPQGEIEFEEPTPAESVVEEGGEESSLNEHAGEPEPLVENEADGDQTSEDVHQDIQPSASDDIAAAYETLTQLETILVPEADLEDIAFRLLGIDEVPDVIETSPKIYEIGDIETFWLSNLDTNQSFQQDVELAYITDHVYFWIEPGVNYNQNALEELVETFEDEIYPTNRAFFGSEWKPGIDQDEHLYIIYARDLGYSVAGYFSSTDSVHPIASEYSNGHETFMLNADAIGLSELFTYGVMAHEFQHMIHWYQDKNETPWLNEGFSELATLLNGYYESGFDQLYLWEPDLQLNDWPNDGNTTPHYGAAFLFVTYFMDRFGSEATQALVADPQNGMPSVDNALEQINAVETSTGEPITTDEFFRDWSITNLIDDSTVQDGQFAYSSLDNFAKTYAYESVTNCTADPIFGQVTQYGVDYYELMCSGEVDFTFYGDQFVDLLPVAPNSGAFSFWSNKGDHSDMTLTRQFDLTPLAVDEEVILEYALWFDIETDWDYVYVLTSLDGERWEFFETPLGTSSNPIGNNYEWGYTGTTGTWVQESLDLSEFAGQKVWVRFEYITDAAVNGEGLLIDDMALRAIDYYTDFESNEGGWEAKGFVRTRNQLPQTYLLSLVIIDNADQITIQEIELSDQNEGNFSINFNDIDRVYLVISGTTRYTRTPAIYTVEMD